MPIYDCGDPECAECQRAFGPGREKAIANYYARATSYGEISATKPGHRYDIGEQPCQNLLRGDADIAALGEGNRRNVHQCFTCGGNRTWCENCKSDHHDGGWETCKPGAYSEDGE